MGFLDAVFGGGKKLKGAAPDRLFAMTTAYVMMQTALGIETTGAAGIVFQPLATADFEQILRDAEELCAGPPRRRERRSSRPTTNTDTAGSSCATLTSTT